MPQLSQQGYTATIRLVRHRATLSPISSSSLPDIDQNVARDSVKVESFRLELNSYVMKKLETIVQ